VQLNHVTSQPLGENNSKEAHALAQVLSVAANRKKERNTLGEEGFLQSLASVLERHPVRGSFI
jgi:hypothetical protein